MVTLWSATQEVASSNNPFLHRRLQVQIILFYNWFLSLNSVKTCLIWTSPLRDSPPPDMLTPVQLGHHHRIPSDVVKHVHVGRLTFNCILVSHCERQFRILLCFRTKQFELAKCVEVFHIACRGEVNHCLLKINSTLIKLLTSFCEAPVN